MLLFFSVNVRVLVLFLFFPLDEDTRIHFLGEETRIHLLWDNSPPITSRTCYWIARSNVSHLKFRWVNTSADVSEFKILTFACLNVEKSLLRGVDGNGSINRPCIIFNFIFWVFFLGEERGVRFSLFFYLEWTFISWIIIFCSRTFSYLLYK
jgi:hypothetical protein